MVGTVRLVRFESGRQRSSSAVDGLKAVKCEWGLRGGEQVSKNEKNGVWDVCCGY